MSSTPKPNPTLRPLWSLRSWEDKPVAQAVVYADEDALSSALRKLTNFPDLVPSHEIDRLCEVFRSVAQGQLFVIQGGDCAEAFHDVLQPVVSSKRQLLTDQARILSDGLQVPVVPIGRIAGQYSKPRSNCHEVLSCGTVVSAFRGDNINGSHETDRRPDPERLCIGYHLAAATLSMLRASAGQGNSEIDRYILPSSGIYTSHEALHLPLEASMSRYGYNTSAHMLWIGERTRSLDGAHVEYMRGLRNPVGIKIGPNSSPSDIVNLLDVLNPQRIVGKIVLITRLGHKSVQEKLPALILAVVNSKHQPVWFCDPCHGNTVATPSKVKTRVVEDMMRELKATHLVHMDHGSRLGGIHLEQSGEADITECVDDHRQDLATYEFPRYHSLCDPRLSKHQAESFVAAYVKFVQELSRPTEIQETTIPLAVWADGLGHSITDQRGLTVAA